MTTTLQRVRFTATEYLRVAPIMAGQRTKPIGGEIIETLLMGTAHVIVVDRLERHPTSLKS
jgi:hypothetical protein